jgi:hypothetical protein
MQKASETKTSKRIIKRRDLLICIPFFGSFADFHNASNEATSLRSICTARQE